MKESLVDTLSQTGKPVEIGRYPDGGTVLVLPHGGRVLGLFAAGSDENFLWTHPALESAESARAFYGSDQWHNSGGDRTWLAPEVDIFLPDYPRTDRYWQPRQLDPGRYDVVATGAGIELTTRLSLTLARSKEEVEVRVAKTVGPASNPLRHERSGNVAGIDYAGYSLRTTLEWCGGGSSSAAVGLWNLLQMPHGGVMLFPTHVRTQPRVYFGNIDTTDLVAGDHQVRYHMRAPGEHKIGLRAVAVTGRVGYLYPARGGRWALVVRNFFVNPSGLYVDVPWDDPTDLGYAVQACNVNSGLGRFSELEYHVPAAGPAAGRMLADDTSQVWAFRGSWEQVGAVAGLLLTGEPLPAIERSHSHV
jgi:hypothetical protein